MYLPAAPVLVSTTIAGLSTSRAAFTEEEHVVSGVDMTPVFEIVFNRVFTYIAL
jgi:hypothetical protein